MQINELQFSNIIFLISLWSLDAGKFYVKQIIDKKISSCDIEVKSISTKYHSKKSEEKSNSANTNKEKGECKVEKT